jgi:hypothetical protein
VVPGDERPLLLDNPTALFGEQEMAAALETFRSGGFTSAHTQYAHLCEQIAEPVRARFMRTLSALYRAWCDLDLAALPEHILAMEEGLQAAHRELTQDTSECIAAQLKFLQTLATEPPDPAALLVCFHVLGKHYLALGRHDFAALLFYRTIEGCLARRLETRASGFLCKTPDYGLLGDVGEITARYRRVARDTAGGEDATLPTEISMLHAARLLYSLDDPYMARAGLKTPSSIRNLRGLAAIRNDSVLAHGHRTVSPKESKLLMDRAEHLLTVFWQMHGDGEDLGQLSELLKFVDTDR